MVTTRLTDFQLLRLKSERLRAIGMLMVLAVVSLIGFYNLLFAPESKMGLGRSILYTVFVFAFFESIYLLVVRNAIKKKKKVMAFLRYFEAIVEGLLPVAAMAMFMDVSDNPYVVLLSPAYPFILIIISASALRLTPYLTLITGLISSVCYAILTIRVLYFDGFEYLNPHPNNLYLFMSMMLFVAAIVMYFITVELRSYVDVAVEDMALQDELELASEVQKNLLPSPLPELEGYDVAAFSTPAKHAGGDYYDLVIPDSKQAIFMLADVAGHGIGPALLTVSSRAYFRAILGEHQKISEIIERVNQLMACDLRAGQFVTLTALVLCMNTHTAKYFSAGHGPTLVVRKKEGTVERMEAQSIPLGIDVPLKMDPPIKFSLSEGDIVAMFSDGCYEGKNDEDEAFGIERVVGLIKENQDKPVDEIITLLQETITSFTGRKSQADDMTMLLLKRLPVLEKNIAGS
jgi:stage II sporulation SpoE-like protein